jgi:hypothetical protein
MTDDGLALGFLVVSTHLHVCLPTSERTFWTSPLVIVQSPRSRDVLVPFRSKVCIWLSSLSISHPRFLYTVLNNI